jgi:16S rRNA (guanine527-N7)-methyltransferase
LTSLEFRDRLVRRARRAKAHLTIDMLGPLEVYFRLLTQWNAKINLTALALDPPTEVTFDRLLVEPLAASRHIEAILRQLKSGSEPIWFDLGSGGGSPAIPLKIARPALRLTMVESKERKSAFLREAIRALSLAGGDVLTSRFEDVAAQSPEACADLVTVRAVRTDEALFSSASLMLKNGGHLLMFRPAHSPTPDPPGFLRERTLQLTDGPPPAFLSIFRRVFHVEQKQRR